MPEFPLLGGQRTENTGVDASNSAGIIVTSDASSHSKGSWTELISSTSFPANNIMVMFVVRVDYTDSLIDIAVGASSSEEIILKNLIMSGGKGMSAYGGHYMFPIKIPTGSRVSARSQDVSSSAEDITISAILSGQGFLPSQPLGIIDTYGDDPSDTGGMLVDSGSTKNVKGDWSEIVASTTRSIRTLSVGIGGQNNDDRRDESWLVDIAVGADGSEQILIPDLMLDSDRDTDVILPMVYNMIPTHIPAGSRLSARAQSDQSDATDRKFDIILYGAG